MTIHHRPVFLDLRLIRLPLPGVLSILHRISGLLLVVALPLLIGLLTQALASPADFAATAAVFDHALVKLWLLLVLWSFFHHLLAGGRHLLLDLGLFVERSAARRSAWIVFAISGGLTLISWGFVQ